MHLSLRHSDCVCRPQLLDPLSNVRDGDGQRVRLAPVIEDVLCYNKVCREYFLYTGRRLALIKGGREEGLLKCA